MAITTWGVLELLAERVRPGDVLLTLGAGDIGRVAKGLPQRLATAEGEGA